MNITKKLGLQGKITQKHSEEIEEIIQQKLHEAEQHERERIILEFTRILDMWETIDLSTRNEKAIRAIQLKDLIKELK